MDGKKLITRPKEYQVAVCLNLNLLPAFPRPWQTVPSPVPSHVSVASHRCPFPQEGAEAFGIRQGGQTGSLHLESVNRPFKGGPMDAHVGNRVDPCPCLAVKVIEVAEAGSRSEVVLHVLDAAFNTPLGLSPIRTTKLNLDSQSKSKIEELAVPHRCTPAVPAQHHKFGIVVKALFGDPAKFGEGIEMAAYELLSRSTRHELHIYGSRPTENHHKSPHLPKFAVRRAVRERPKVYLRLFSGFRLIAHRRGSACGSVSQRPYKILEDRVSAGVTLLPDFSQQYDAVVHSLRNASHDILGVGLQLRRSFGTRLAFQGSVGIPQVSPYRVSRDPQRLGDLPNRFLAFQLIDRLHSSTLQHCSFPPPTLDGNRSILRWGVGHFIPAHPGSVYHRR